MINEFYFDEVVGRLKKALKIKTDIELAEKINMKPTTFNSRKKAQSLPYDEFIELANTEKLDFNWLLTGEGEMLKSKPPVTVYDRRADDIDDRAGKTERRVEKAVTLLNELSPQQQQEILATIEEKKRLNEMQRTLDRLASAWEQEHHQQQSAVCPCIAFARFLIGFFIGFCGFK